MSRGRCGGGGGRPNLFFLRERPQKKNKIKSTPKNEEDGVCLSNAAGLKGTGTNRDVAAAAVVVGVFVFVVAVVVVFVFVVVGSGGGGGGGGVLAKQGGLLIDRFRLASDQRPGADK